MAARKSSTRSRKNAAILLVEADVLVRFALADHLRACALTVIEAASADDAKAILIAGPACAVLLSDAQLAEGAGFALAQWVRRHRPGIEVILTASLAGKAQAVCDLVAREPACKPPADVAQLTAKLNAMLAERKRRMRQQPRNVVPRTPRRKRI